MACTLWEGMYTATGQNTRLTCSGNCGVGAAEGTAGSPFCSTVLLALVLMTGIRSNRPALHVHVHMYDSLCVHVSILPYHVHIHLYTNGRKGKGKKGLERWGSKREGEREREGLTSFHHVY